MVDPPPEGAPPEAAPPQAATDSILYSSLGLEEGRTNRFGIHVVEDAEVIAAANDDDGNKDDEEFVDNHSPEEAAVVIEGTHQLDQLLWEGS